MNQNGIEFTNITNESYTIVKNKISIDSYNKLQAGKVTPVINAIAIDWNGAQVSEDRVINSTGELISWIKEGMNNSSSSSDSSGLILSKDQLDALNYLVDFVKNIKGKIDEDELESNYYYYIGIRPIFETSTIDNLSNIGETGWHLIGNNINNISISNKALDTSDQTNIIVLDTNYATADGLDFYIVIPQELNIYDGLGNILNNNYESLGSIELYGHIYKIFKGHDFEFIYNIY